MRKSLQLTFEKAKRLFISEAAPILSSTLSRAAYNVKLYKS
jgi:hypothetical protein